MRGGCLGEDPVLTTAEGELARQVGRGEEEEGGAAARKKRFSKGAEMGRAFPLCEPKLCPKGQGPPAAALMQQTGEERDSGNWTLVSETSLGNRAHWNEESQHVGWRGRVHTSRR